MLWIQITWNSPDLSRVFWALSLFFFPKKTTEDSPSIASTGPKKKDVSDKSENKYWLKQSEREELD